MGYKKPTGDRLGRRAKVKPGQRESLDWIKTKMTDTYFFLIGGWGIVNSQ